MNTLMLSGRLAADPIAESNDTSNRCRFRLAVDAYNASTKQREADFFSLIAFGRTADVIANYCHKGSYVVVRCHLKPRQWNDPKTGDRRYETSIVCDEIELGPRTTQSGGEPRQERHEPTPPDTQAFDFDDLPF